MDGPTGRNPWTASGAVLIILAVASQASPSERIGAYLDVGLGGGKTQPFITGGVNCGTIGLGASTGFVGPTRALFEFRATAGRDGGMRIPEWATGGEQSLVTFLGGLELVKRGSARGPFLTAGLGVGHSTIARAHGPIEPPTYGFAPLHDRTAAAFGLGLGYRSAGGPGPLGLQLALRTHGLLGEGVSASAYATAITLGVAY